jgi:parallel beta-helix repeat protein
MQEVISLGLGLFLMAAPRLEPLGGYPPYPGMLIKDGILIPDEPVKAGAEPATGLQKSFPPLVRPAENPTTPEKVDLGHLLFFDPLLSRDNTLSCAHCHHPDLGFSDGLPRARGKGSHGAGPERAGGVELPRAAPSLWNALYNHRQFWDGRASDLEDQARNPITHPLEMGESPEALVKEMEAIPEYRRLFDRAFGGTDGSAVTFENAVKAIASFERTLVSFRSPFDLYVEGNPDALSPAERRGLKLFFSTKARCSECHGLPNFANRDFKVIGVPDPPGGPRDEHNAAAEPGRGGGPNGAFKIPTLRNIALTAPYMHNGIFKTLGEVLDFYSGGGGRGRGLDVPLQDDKIRKFPLTAEEKADLIAFLGSLTDVSALPQVPQGVPSGLPVVRRVVSSPPPARLVRRTPELGLSRREVIEVIPGASIQEALDRAGRGGTVRVHPGVYHEDLLVIHHDVTIEGILENGKRPLLDGRGQISDGIVALGNRFEVRGLEVKSYQGNGVVARGARDVVLKDLVVSSPGLYGLYPVECEGVLVESCFVSGARDAGIYVGQSRKIAVRRNEVFGNVAGIEIENSLDARVEENHVHDNAGGILVFLLPFNPSKEAREARVARNRVLHNNTPNFADPGAMVANVLQGTGIMVLAADATDVTENEVIGNQTYGVAVSSLVGLYPEGTRFDVEPFADENRVHGNVLKENGRDPDGRLKSRFGLPGRDLIWDGTGKGNLWHEPGASSFPETLPSSKEPSFKGPSVKG